MAFLEWNDTYSVGVAKMDDQHKKWIGYINQLHDALAIGKGKAETAVIVNSLVEYTNFHFSAEEKLLTENNYIGLVNQQNKHKAFVVKVQEFQNDVNSGNLTTGIKVNQFLKDWLIEHIMGEDKKYTKFLNDKGIK
jgi:hemerythrin